MPVDTTFQGIGYFEGTFRHQISKDGRIGDLTPMFQTRFGDGEGEWPVEAGRYRLIWMPGCPYAHRAVLVWKLLGLDAAISLGTTGILRSPKGWVFSEDEGEVDPVLKIHYLHDIYTRHDPSYEGRSTVPIVVDTFTGQGANNDHYNLTTAFETAWRPFHKEGAPELYPEKFRDSIDEWNAFLVKRIVSGFYDLGFARSQEAYEQGYVRLFEALDYLEEHLKGKRFLLGDFITDADLRLFPSLVRYDVAYHQVFRANRQRLRDYPNLWAYARDIYQTEGVREYTPFSLIARHYQTSPHLRPLWGNVYGLTAKGPDVSEWETPSEREGLSAGKGKFLFSRRNNRWIY